MSQMLLKRLRLALRHRRAVEWNERGITQAAVAVILAHRARGLELLLIQRAERPGDVWSGHMALPGGKWSPEDSTLLATAMRETREEVGLDLAAAELIGQLDDQRPGSRLLPRIGVRPFVFHLVDPPPTAHGPEVADSVWVPLDVLRAPATRQETDIFVQGEWRRFPSYVVGSHVVWGLTERILSWLLGLVGEDQIS
jgi:8-oxo-dGTP pyrophosphatase MutT (NUDIX family)